MYNDKAHYYRWRLHERVSKSSVVIQTDHQLRKLWPLEHEYVLYIERIEREEEKVMIHVNHDLYY